VCVSHWNRPDYLKQALASIQAQQARQALHALIEGHSLNAYSISERARRIAYVPQLHTPTFAFTVESVVLMGRTAHGNLFSRPTAHDRAVSAIYEPGSTFKLITLAAAFDQNLIRPEEVFDCENGKVYVAGHRIRDHKAFGMLTVADILAQSSDVGAIKIALRLGPPKFYDYIRNFGFGQQTGSEVGDVLWFTETTGRHGRCQALTEVLDQNGGEVGLDQPRGDAGKSCLRPR
jgi:hypothetical protein